MSTPRDEHEARRLTVQASRALAAAGQGDMIWGHVAVRDPERRGIWIKAPGFGLAEVSDDRLHLVSFDGVVVAGDGAPHQECVIHLEILRRREDAHCVVHTHARAAVAFAALDTPLLAISHEGSLFGGSDVPRFRDTGGLVTTPTLGRSLAATLGDGPAALMPKHGLVAAGRSVGAAVMHAVLLDRACAVQLQAQAAGPIVISSDPDEAAAKRRECWPDRQLEAGWNYLVRLADADQ